MKMFRKEMQADTKTLENLLKLHVYSHLALQFQLHSSIPAFLSMSQGHVQSMYFLILLK